MEFIILAFNLVVFIFGLCIGSFLNCVIYRTELQENMPKGSSHRKAVSFLRGKSFCPHCKHTLNWKDLFPVFSFLFLGGKCKYCKKKISWQYPLVELATAVIFLLIFNKFSVIPSLTGNPEYVYLPWIPAFAGMTIYLVFLFYIASSLILIFIYDLKHYIIPDKVLFPAILLTVIFNFQFLIFNEFSIFIYSILAALISSGFFLLIFLISGGRWMGFGDVKLCILLGLLLGLPNILLALFLAFFFGAIIGVIMMVFYKRGLKSEIPFGPFLITGTFMAMFLGQEIINWYMSLFII